jgi:hypothetical protein
VDRTWGGGAFGPSPSAGLLNSDTVVEAAWLPSSAIPPVLHALPLGFELACEGVFDKAAGGAESTFAKLPEVACFDLLVTGACRDSGCAMHKSSSRTSITVNSAPPLSGPVSRARSAQRNHHATRQCECVGVSRRVAEPVHSVQTCLCVAVSRRCAQTCLCVAVSRRCAQARALLCNKAG